MIAQGDTFRLSRPRVAHTQLFILSQTYSAHLTTPLPAETLGNHCTSYLIRDATRWKRISESQSTSYTLKDAELSCNDSIRVTSRSPTNQLAQESLSRCATRAITAILGTPRRRLYYTVTNRRRIRAWEQLVTIAEAEPRILELTEHLETGRTLHSTTRLKHEADVKNSARNISWYTQGSELLLCKNHDNLLWS
jgi:hypothetical protein